MPFCAENVIIISLKGGDRMEKKKKVYRDGGIRHDQKMKPFLVYEYLMRNSDENNVAK